MDNDAPDYTPTTKDAYVRSNYVMEWEWGPRDIFQKVTDRLPRR